MHDYNFQHTHLPYSATACPCLSIDCVVTSPPYWGLRDYGVSGQLGLEPTIDEYISNMTAVFKKVRR
ncbi:MAG TPA: hypothetical protein ENH82_06420, partial [bacterium]|nr:hypothetical protein [bacterium]